MTRSRGFTYIGLLLLVALTGVALAAAGTVWHTAAKRAKETELLFIGNEFRQAIASFYTHTPQSEVPRYPMSLDELVKDPRFPNAVRHLRRIYRDPMTGAEEWGLIRRAGGGIVGVHSLSTERPLKIAGFRPQDEVFSGKTKYSEWEFRPATTLATPPLTAPTFRRPR